MADATTMTTKGQVTVPREIRDRLGLKSGDKVTFMMLGNGTVVMRPKTRRLADLAGSLTRPGQPNVLLEREVVRVRLDQGRLNPGELPLIRLDELPDGFRHEVRRTALGRRGETLKAILEFIFDADRDCGHRSGNRCCGCIRWEPPIWTCDGAAA